MATISEILNASISGLQPLYDENEATSISRLLFRHFLNMSNVELAIYKQQGMDDEDKKKIQHALKRLQKGEPIQYVVGEVEFSNCKLKVNPDVLIPRPETEELVQLIMMENKISGLNILDIGTGSGCIAISLARGMAESKVSAVDVSENALTLARENAFDNNAKVDFINMDILDEEKSSSLSTVDIIVSNPPYVLEKEKSLMHDNVLKFEPAIALFVQDNDPLLFYKAIGQVAMQKLRIGGKLYFEINEAYGNDIASLLENEGFVQVEIKKDIHGKDRFVRGIKLARKKS